jgi:hypothetical protein
MLTTGFMRGRKVSVARAASVLASEGVSYSVQLSGKALVLTGPCPLAVWERAERAFYE